MVRTLRRLHCKRVWFPTESHLLFNFLELKAVFLALKSFEHLCRAQIVLLAKDNTAVVAYLNYEGVMKSGSLCALLWRLLPLCHPRIVLRARHILGHSRQVVQDQQVIQMEWFLSQEVFTLFCFRWVRP